MADLQVYSSNTSVLYAPGAVPVTASLGRVLAAVNIPSENLAASEGRVNVAFRQSSPVAVSLARVLAAVRGRVYNPKLRAWTFNLDGHSFYVLRLSEDKTLVYDVSTDQWSWWSSGTKQNWRASLGMNWRSPGSVAQNYGSNIVVGDDTLGILWVLDPEQGYDDNSVTTETPTIFPRVATTQLMTRGRFFKPIFSAYLTASNGQPPIDGSTVTLKYSDDLGNTFNDAGAIQVESLNYNQEFSWKSLGMIPAPGRIFRIEDDSAFQRIDSLDINDGSEQS